MAIDQGGRLPEPVRQYEIFDGPHFVARVDFAYPAHKLVIEADGYGYHTGRRAWEHDLKRRNKLEALGWRTLHVTSQQGAAFVNDVLRALGRAREQRRTQV